MLHRCWMLVLLFVVLCGAGKVMAEDAPEQPAPAAVESSDPAGAETTGRKPTGSTESPEAPAADTAPSADGQKYSLEYKFTVGEQLRTEVVHKAAVQTTIDGSTQKAETQSRSIKVWRVDSVADDGTVKFMHMVESIDMWQRTQGRKEVRYNSQKDDDAPPGYEEVAAAVNKPLTVVTMNKFGKILKREERRAHPIGASTQMTIPLPEQPIAISQTWDCPVEIDVTLSEGGMKKIHTRQKFTLESVKDGLATIQVDSQVLTPIHDPAIEAQLIQRMSSGSVKFDIERGRVISQQLDLDRHVIGFSGAASSMHYVTRFTEELLPPTAQTAARPPQPKATQPKAAPPASGPAAPASKSTPNQNAPTSSKPVKNPVRQAAAPTQKAVTR